jgi:hypothetical protein
MLARGGDGRLEKCDVLHVFRSSWRARHPHRHHPLDLDLSGGADDRTMKVADSAVGPVQHPVRPPLAGPGSACHDIPRPGEPVHIPVRPSHSLKEEVHRPSAAEPHVHAEGTDRRDRLELPNSGACCPAGSVSVGYQPTSWARRCVRVRPRPPLPGGRSGSAVGAGRWGRCRSRR